MSLDRIFNSATKLPTLPKLVQELIESFQDEDVKIDDITDKLTLDPALTAKILRMANSAHFGGNRNIATVNDAVILLGFNSLRTLVMASGVTGAFDYPSSFDKNLFWKNSFETASLCKTLARFCKADGETAFTCGMLNDIGTILMLTSFPEETANVLSGAAEGENRQALEKAAFGFTASEVSSGLANRWKFPDIMTEALRWQHEPQKSEQGAYAYLVALGSFIQEHRPDFSSEEMCEKIPRDLAEGAGVDTQKLVDNIDSIMEVEDPMEGLFD